MVLTIPRAWSRGGSIATLVRDQGDASASRQWAAERGSTRWRAAGDIAGGFPGFAGQGGALSRVTIGLTDRYLLVAEKRPHGFGLPLDRLVLPLRLDPDGARGGLITITYRDGHLIRAFFIRPSASLLHRRGDGERLIELLGSSACEKSPAPTSWPTISWLDARQYQHENVIWSGRATAPDGSGVERASCDLWLTTCSLIWANPDGEGIHRLSLEQMREAFPFQVGHQTPVPGVAISYQDEADVRHDVCFVFERHSPAERNGRERGAMLVGLRSRGIAHGAGAPLVQPWSGVSRALPVGVPLASIAAESEVAVSVGGHYAEPGAGTNHVEVLDDHPSAFTRGTPSGWDPIPGGLDDALPPAWVSAGEAVAAVKPSPARDPQLGLGASTEQPAPRERSFSSSSQFATADTFSSLAIVEATRSPEPTAATLAEFSLLRRSGDYEGAALAALAETVDQIGRPGLDRRTLSPLPCSSMLAAALAELEAAEAKGVLPSEAANARRARLMALNEAGPRLRALIELRDLGLLSNAVLEEKRVAILAPLSRVVFVSA